MTLVVWLTRMTVAVSPPRTLFPGPPQTAAAGPRIARPVGDQHLPPEGKDRCKSPPRRPRAGRPKHLRMNWPHSIIDEEAARWVK